MDWSRRTFTSFEYVRVSGHTFEELGAVDGIESGGSIVMNLNTSIKQSGTVTLKKNIDFGDDLIRVYADVKDANGASARVVIATLLAVTPSREIESDRSHLEVGLLSVLQMVSDDAIDTSLTIPANTHSVGYAANLIRAVGIEVRADDSDSRLTSAWTYDAGTSKLKIVNELLSYANFMGATVDGMGRAILRRQVSQNNLQPVYEFKDDETSLILAGSVEDEFDWYDTPNKIVCLVSDPDRTLVATATNDDPASRYSTVSRGRTIVRYEEYNDIENQAELQEKANLLLETSTRQKRAVTFSHGYVPIEIGLPVRIHHNKGGVDMTGIVQTMEINLSVGMDTSTTVRSFV